MQFSVKSYQIGTIPITNQNKMASSQVEINQVLLVKFLVKTLRCVKPIQSGKALSL